MPLIEVKTNVQVKDHQRFIKELSPLSASTLSKPISYICVLLQDNLPMLFGDSDDPTYIVNVQSIGLDSSAIERTNKELSEFLEKELKASSDRGYIFFNDPGSANVGWNGNTFDKILK